MERKSLYITFLNTFLGVVLSLVLNGRLMVGMLICIFLLTICWIERHWVYENIFKNKFSYAVGGYAGVVVVMGTVLLLLAQPNREVSLIVKSVHAYLDHLKPNEYQKAYPLLSTLSKKGYSEAEFIEDHRRFQVKVQDFRIDKILINEFDANKATVEVSSPFAIYGQKNLTFDLIKEDSHWNIVGSPTTFFARNSSPDRSVSSSANNQGGKEKKNGKIGDFFKSIF